MNGQDESGNGLMLQGMKTRMFHDLEAKGRNWHKEFPSVLWHCTPMSIEPPETLFHLVYGVDAVLPSDIYLESTQVEQFNEADQDEARELDPNPL
jgi:hypothetical protein